MLAHAHELIVAMCRGSLLEQSLLILLDLHWVLVALSLALHALVDVHLILTHLLLCLELSLLFAANELLELLHLLHVLLRYLLTECS